MGGMLLVILLITANLTATLVVALSVFMTDLFLFGLLFYWGLTLNPMVILNVMIAIGTSVYYSAHIAYAFLVESVPPEKQHKYNTPMKIRTYKA